MCRIPARTLDRWSVEFRIPVLELLQLVEIHERTRKEFQRRRTIWWRALHFFRDTEIFEFSMHRVLKKFDEALREEWNSRQPFDRGSIAGREVVSGIGSNL